MPLAKRLIRNCTKRLKPLEVAPPETKARLLLSIPGIQNRRPAIAPGPALRLPLFRKGKQGWGLSKRRSFNVKQAVSLPMVGDNN